MTAPSVTSSQSDYPIKYCFSPRKYPGKDGNLNQHGIVDDGRFGGSECLLGIVPQGKAECSINGCQQNDDANAFEAQGWKSLP